jgi:single-stranded-DNA-specific exonuclease
MTAALDVRDVVVDYGGVRALDRVSVSVAPGEIVGVFGLLGAGHVELSRALFGAELLDGGELAPDADESIDLVALATVADAVPLQGDNRRLVVRGLRAIRERPRPAIAALCAEEGIEPRLVDARTLGFSIAPCINAAGRLAHPERALDLLLAPDLASAEPIAQELWTLNRERREVERTILEQAVAQFEAEPPEIQAAGVIVSAGEGWHEGVVGIVASRLKDRLHRPVICFAPAEEGGANVLRGSGRSIPGLHLRDALDVVSKRAPGLIRRFGGHAQAAGLSIAAADYERFAAEFERTVDALLPADARLRVVETDGALDAMHFSLEVARLLDDGIWGQGFPQPVFCDTFTVENQRVVGERHLKLWLVKGGRRIEAMRFGALDQLPPQVRAAYRLSVNEFNGLKNIQLNVEHYE